jgi:hypothetical protein
VWSARQESNLQLPVCKTGALPFELRAGGDLAGSRTRVARVAAARVPFATRPRGSGGRTLVRRAGVEPARPEGIGVTARSRPLRDYRRVSLVLPAGLAPALARLSTACLCIGLRERGGTGGIRTPALPVKSRLLLPLSYDPVLVGPVGVAPTCTRISDEGLDCSATGRQHRYGAWHRTGVWFLGLESHQHLRVFRPALGLFSYRGVWRFCTKADARRRPGKAKRWAQRRRQPDGGRGGTRTRGLLLAGQAPSRSATRPSGSRGRGCSREAGALPAPPGSEPGTLAVAPLVSLEEGVRFELTSPEGDPVFGTGAFSRSATLPSGADDGS